MPSTRPIAWVELTSAQQPACGDFVTLIACYLSVAALNAGRLLDQDKALAGVVENFDEILDEASQTVNLLVLQFALTKRTFARARRQLTLLRF